MKEKGPLEGGNDEDDETPPVSPHAGAGGENADETKEERKARRAAEKEAKAQRKAEKAAKSQRKAEKKAKAAAAESGGSIHAMDGDETEDMGAAQAAADLAKLEVEKKQDVQGEQLAALKAQVAEGGAAAAAAWWQGVCESEGHGLPVAVSVAFGACFDETMMPKDVKGGKAMLGAWCAEGKAEEQLELLKAFEKLCIAHLEAISKRIGHVLKEFYEEDLLEEENIFDWYDGMSSFGANRDVREAAKAFVVWLREASDDESSEEED